MIFATTMKDLLKRTALTEAFFYDLDPFQLNYIEMCFKRSLDEQIGLMTETEMRNYQLFMFYKSQNVENFYPEMKKAA